MINCSRVRNKNFLTDDGELCYIFNVVIIVDGPLMEMDTLRTSKKVRRNNNERDHQEDRRGAAEGGGACI